MPEGIQYVVNKARSYYMLEIAIPWKALGVAGPRVEQTMRVNVEISDRRTNEHRKEAIPDTQSNQSWTWPEFRLVPSPQVGIDVPAADFVSDGPVEYYNLQGMRVENPAGGVYIRRQGNVVIKEIIK